MGASAVALETSMPATIAGAVYVFSHLGQVYMQTAFIKPPQSDFGAGLQPRFGYVNTIALSADGTVLAVGSSSIGVTIFRRNVSGWQLEQQVPCQQVAASGWSWRPTPPSSLAAGTPRSPSRQTLGCSRMTRWDGPAPERTF